MDDGNEVAGQAVHPRASALVLRRRDEARHCLLEVHGEVDVATSAQLRENLWELLAEAPPAVVVDLDGVPFLDSTGLGVLVAAYQRASELNIPMSLGRPRRIVANALTLVQIDTVIPVRATLEEAVRHVESGSWA